VPRLPAEWSNSLPVLPSLRLGACDHVGVPRVCRALAADALPDGRMAFRESFFVAFTGRYYPVMRGLVVVDAGRNQVRVEGICNWMTLSIAALCASLPLVIAAAWPMLLILALFAYCYVIQRRRYHGVADALREQMRTELPDAIMQLRRRIG